MFTLDSPHILSLILALLFSFLVHFALTGFANKLQSFLIMFLIFPVALMALTLFVPQDLLQYSSYLIVLGGFLLASFKLPKRLGALKDFWKNCSFKEKWIIAGVVIYLLCFFMTSTVLGGPGLIQDALVYHLEGPKEWALYLNGAKFNSNNPIAFTTSYYDYFYYFLILLVKPLFIHAAPLASTYYEFLSYMMVLTAQIFTAIVALLYIPLLILRFSKSLGLYKYLVLFFIFGLRDITWSWGLPKNDAYPFLCFLTGVHLFYTQYILKKDNQTIFSLFLAALIVGIGTASKLTNSYVVIFSLFFFVSFHYKNVLIYVGKIGLPKTILIVSLGLGIGASVFLLRNFISTGNPFFPIAKFGFPNIYLTDYANRPEMYSLPGTWSEALLKIKGHFLGQPQLVLLLIATLFLRARTLSIFYICMVIYMAKQTGPMFRFRMTTIFLVLSLILFILAFHQKDLINKFKAKKNHGLIFVFIVLIFAKIQVENLVKYPFKVYPQKIAETVRINVENWDPLLKINLENRTNPTYVFSTMLEVTPYFSRYPITSLYDSVPKYRYEYYPKYPTKTSTSPDHLPTSH